MKLQEFLDRFVHVRKCVSCRHILEYELCHHAFCPKCFLRWNMAKTESCAVCHQSALECTCMPKGLSKAGALCLRKLIFYQAKRGGEPQNKIIYFLKRNPNKRAAGFIARELSHGILHELSVLGIEDREQGAIVVNVPRGRKAKNKYGFDQAELVCRALSETIGIPYAPAVKRRIGGKEQKTLDQKKRFANIQDLFRVAEKQSVEGKCVILFDDVVTTGASMAACVKLLNKMGATGVICACIAQN